MNSITTTLLYFRLHYRIMKDSSTVQEGSSSQTACLANQSCPMCRQPALTLTEGETEVPYFGKLFLFGMNCAHCKYHKADVESAEKHEASKFSLEISSKDDLNARVVKSSEATVKVSYVGSIDPGPASEGYVTNVEGVLTRIKEQVETLHDSAEDEEDRKKAKNLLKKIQRIMWGEEKVTISIEDPTGNSAIISDRAKRTAMK